ncbi:unnamed protein product [Linum trigynum]|uniref:RNase H type-1 domain-containing protein n=1 Tax=Linum trigynum TaxID=586398 RepID=A0AAV2F211_9ROSI
MQQQCQSAFTKTHQAMGVGDGRSTRLLGWDRPPPGWVALNTDGSVVLSSASAMAGGILRDSNDRFLRALSANLGDRSITHAELARIYHNLILAWEMGARKVRLQTDSMTAIAIIQTNRDNHPHRTMAASIRQLLERDWEVTLEHVFRESNYVADHMATVGHSLSFGVHVVENPGPNLPY